MTLSHLYNFDDDDDDDDDDYGQMVSAHKPENAADGHNKHGNDSADVNVDAPGVMQAWKCKFENSAFRECKQ